MRLLPSTHYPLPTRQKGFTLIEVLIVVGIIGLLASVVLSGLGSVRSRGRDARRVADLRQVQQGLELYYTRCQFYPGGPDCAQGSGNLSWPELQSALKESNLGITNVSNDPSCRSQDDDCDNNYVYSSDGEQYVLQARLEDKESPLKKDSYINGSDGNSFPGTQCGQESGNYFYYCVKF
jgi:prepilin-type N-terminal cleavage/methylation domain-containing protein